jgi:hypothetical protein
MYAYEQTSHQGTGYLHIGYALLMFHKPHLVLLRQAICCVAFVWYFT